MHLIIHLSYATATRTGTGTNGYIKSMEVERQNMDVPLNVTMIAAAIILFGTMMTVIMGDFLILEVD